MKLTRIFYKKGRKREKIFGGMEGKAVTLHCLIENIKIMNTITF